MIVGDTSTTLVTLVCPNCMTTRKHEHITEWYATDQRKGHDIEVTRDHVGVQAISDKGVRGMGVQASLFHVGVYSAMCSMTSVTHNRYTQHARYAPHRTH